jgi:hypothetical protein
MSAVTPTAMHRRNLPPGPCSAAPTAPQETHRRRQHGRPRPPAARPHLQTGPRAVDQEARRPGRRSLGAVVAAGQGPRMAASAATAPFGG